tara:strand:+ start:2118 stop:2711 length:594 start_codon:yes stop_codon:yes gene_type:complete
MQKGYSVEGDVLVINRELTDLDFFVKDFLEILKKYSGYLIVSGFVSISTGRSRGTEDVDILVPVMEKEKFSEFFNELKEKGFWCYQGDDSDKVYPYVQEKTNIRFAKVNEMFPNMEFISIDETRKAKHFEFTHPQKIKIRDFEFNIPPLEFEILYKEIVLGSEKDMIDALHLRTVFSEILSIERFKEFESIVRSENE